MVGLHKNSRKTFRMLLRPFRVVGNQLEATYKWKMTREGLTYRAKHKLGVQCPDFGADMVVGLLDAHCQKQYGINKGTGGE